MMNLQEGEVCVLLEEMVGLCRRVEGELISTNGRGMVSRNMLGCCGKETRGIHIAKLYFDITITRPSTPLAIAT
jgi:hypothetical protein